MKNKIASVVTALLLMLLAAPFASAATQEEDSAAVAGHNICLGELKIVGGPSDADASVTATANQIDLDGFEVGDKIRFFVWCEIDDYQGDSGLWIEEWEFIGRIKIDGEWQRGDWRDYETAPDETDDSARWSLTVYEYTFDGTLYTSSSLECTYWHSDAIRENAPSSVDSTPQTAEDSATVHLPKTNQ